MALSLGGEKSFKGLIDSRWKTFANRGRLSIPAVLNTLAETTRRVNQHWWTLPERSVVPRAVLEPIDEHVKAMTPILIACGES
jgi:serine/threonine-protein kinase HipA